jgi:hypothetical protein
LDDFYSRFYEYNEITEDVWKPAAMEVLSDLLKLLPKVSTPGQQSSDSACDGMEMPTEEERDNSKITCLLDNLMDLESTVPESFSDVKSLLNCVLKIENRTSELTEECEKLREKVSVL